MSLINDILEFDSDTTYKSSKSHEKDVIIENLKKQYRFQKFESEQKIKELEEELKLSKNQNIQYEIQLNENKYVLAIKNLEENLTQIETELCNHKEKEIEYKREIFHLEADILKLKQHNEHFSKSFIRKPNQKTNTSTEILKEFEDNTSSLLLEKDKQIFSLKEKLNEIEIYYQTQLNSCIEQLNQKLHNNPKQCFLGSETEALRLELLTLQEELNREKIIANEQIFELANEIKSSKSHYEGIIAKIEKDYSSKISQNFKQNMDKAQSTEETLMEELKRQDDDLENLRRNNKELEKKVEFVRKQKENLENDYQKRIDLLEKKDLKVEPSKIEAKLKKSYELAKEKLESEITQNNDIIEKLNEIKANNMKKILHLEGENKKYLEINIRFQEKFENMEKTQNENEQNFANIIKGYEEKFKELESKYEFEKQTNSYFRNMSRPTIFKPNLPNSPKNQEKNLLNESLSTELKGIENLSTVNFNLTSEEENTNKSPDSSSNYKKNKSVFKFIPQNTIDEYSSESESSENEVKSSEKLPKIDENIEIEKKEISQSNDNDFQNKSPQEKIKIGIANQDDRETLTEEITKFEEGQMILKLIGNKDEEIEDLKRENQLLKNDLANTEKKWLKELDDKRNKELNQLKSDQNLRRQSIDVLLQNKQMKNFSETDFKKVLKEKKELEAENYRLKKESDGNIEFLKEELKKMEEKISENDVKLIQALNERDYFEQQWKELLEEMKLGKMNLEKDKKVTNEKKVSKWLFCGCK